MSAPTLADRSLPQLDEHTQAFLHQAADAKRIIIDIAQKAGCRSCIKSKSMVSEEINLVPALEEAGIDVVETDLGEFIVQISHDRPSHLVAPIVHKDRASIAKLFSEYFGTPYNDDPQALTMQARVYLRDKFRTSDFGMTGGNFLVAETGQIRCGACLNACPIYRKIGGHAYGSVYPGPIGALITPLFQGLSNFKDLPQASSLCGACYEACPVKINIPRHLINLRRDIQRDHLSSPLERIVYRLWAWAMNSPGLYSLIGNVQKWDLRRRAKKNGDGRWIAELPKIASGWTQIR